MTLILHIIAFISRLFGRFRPEAKKETADEYLDRLIEEATPAWEGVDPEEFMNEVRGREPEPTPEPEPLRIEDHILIGADLDHTPNMGDTITPRYLVIHYTANGSVAETVRHFRKPISSASAHIIIGRFGEVVQMVPFDRAAWHCGISEWKGLKNLNSCTIGIELVNWGVLEVDVDGNLYTWASQPIGKEEAEQIDRWWWHTYTPEQLDACFRVADALVRHYGLEDVLGHSDISPRRKVDPGPLFPMEKLKKHCRL